LKRFANGVSSFVSDFEDLVGIEGIEGSLCFLLLLIFIPMPLVYLALFQSSFLGEFFHVALSPVGVFGIFLLEELDLLFILPPPLLVQLALLVLFNFLLERYFILLLLSLWEEWSFKDVVHMILESCLLSVVGFQQVLHQVVFVVGQKFFEV